MKLLPFHFSLSKAHGSRCETQDGNSTSQHFKALGFFRSSNGKKDWATLRDTAGFSNPEGRNPFGIHRWSFRNALALVVLVLPLWLAQITALAQSATQARVSFRIEVMAVLSKAGC